MECQSSTTPDSKRKSTRSGVDENTLAISRVDENTLAISGVDENTLAISGSFDKTIAVSIVALSGTTIGCPHADVHTVEGEQTIVGKDNGPELTGQHPVSSTHQVDKPLILLCEFEDTTKIKTAVNVTTSINQNIDDKLFLIIFHLPVTG